MDDNLLPDLLSQLFSNAAEKNLDPDGEKTDERNNLLVESLKALVGPSSGLVGTAVNEFLSGKGALHETTRTALTHGSGSAVREVVSFLTTQFKVSSSAAKLIAPLLVNLLPSIGKETGKDTVAKKRPRRKVKPKTASHARTETGSSKKKPKKKTLARPKKSASKPETKKKPSSRVGKKESASTRKPNKVKKTTSLDGS